MHATPRAYVQELARSWPGGRILEIGSRNVNGGVRTLFQRRPATFYLGVDLVDGVGVDVVADAATWHHAGPAFDLVLCLEVFEHTPAIAPLIRTAWRELCPGGRFVFTCAGPARAPHGAAGGLLLPGEFYRNVELEQLRAELGGWWIAELEYRRGELDLVGTVYRP